MTKDVFLQFRSSSGSLYFFEGKVTDELLKSEPEGTKFIPVDYAATIEGGTLDVSPTDWWLILHLDIENQVIATVLNTKNLFVSMYDQRIMPEKVLSIERISQEDFDNGTPFYIPT